MAKKANEGKREKKWGTAGIFIPAGLFIGMGIGWIFGYLVQGLLIGMGVGFLALAIAAFAGRK
jgi:hypothetical protein